MLRERLISFFSLAKPRLTLLVVLTAACGMFLAPGSLGLAKSIGLMLGTFLIVGAANALNCYLERDVDGLMARTKDRPLVTGEISPPLAFWGGWTMAFVACALLYWSSNLLTASLGFLGFLLYIAVYTPLKRHSILALFAGAVPGAIPPMMGWTALTNSVDLTAWLLFGILFFWQLPHFIAISLFRESEYTHAGLKTFPGSLGRNSAQTHMITYTGFLLLVTFLPFQTGLAGIFYLSAALLLGILFAALCVASFFRLQDLNWGRVIFFGSLAYLPLVLGTWALDHWLTRSSA